MDVYAKLEEMGLKFPAPSRLGAKITQVVPFGGNLLYASGMGPLDGGKVLYTGKLGQDVSIETAQEAARVAVLNILGETHALIGDLNRIKRFVKLLCFVASDPAFTEQATVANAASQLLIDLFGEQNGMPARSAIGVAVLPLNIPVEIEAVIELKE